MCADDDNGDHSPSERLTVLTTSTSFFLPHPMCTLKHISLFHSHSQTN